MKYKFVIEPTLEAISQVVQDVESKLVKYKLGDEDRVRAILTLEESLVKMSEVASANSKMTIVVNKGLKKVNLHVSCRGSEVSITDTMPIADLGAFDEEYGAEVEEIIRNRVLRGNASNILYRHRHGVNVLDILVVRNKSAMMYDSLGAMLIGVIVGLIVNKFCSGDMVSWLKDNVFVLLYSLFLTAVKMVVAPLVFFSIASSVSGFGDMKALGRIGMKVFACYMFTTVCAISIGLGLDSVIQPGLGGGDSFDLPGTDAATSNLAVSIKDTIINILPSNFVGAFVDADMLQVIFLAVLIGIAVGRMGKYAQNVRSFIEAMNDLFGSVIEIISRFLPFAIFGSMASLMATINVTHLSLLMAWCGEVFLNLLCVAGVYALLLLVVGRFNPLKFFRTFAPASLTGFFTSSSNATIPTSIQCCRNLGIHPRVYSFSIPLGATINMDGTSVFFVTSTLFLARLYGIEIDAAGMSAFLMTVMLLSVATPGVPGAGTACLLMLFSIVGIPAEALGLIIGVGPIIELGLTMLNVTGDGAVTTAVASAEGAVEE